MRELGTPAEVPAGIIGLGLMGTSITACLLAAGHTVAAVETDPDRARDAEKRVRKLLLEMRRERLLAEPVAVAMGRLTVGTGYSLVAPCRLVLEAIVEDGAAKREALAQIERVVSARAVIGCNSSAIPVSLLQAGLRHPKRVLGIHWAEPAHITRFLEVIRGDGSSLTTARQVVALARYWQKEPTLVRRDIRGFITNRCFYALLREALHLVDEGYATVADVDRSLRNDLGYWMTFAGPFRFMDLTGIPAYEAVARDLFPELSNETQVPRALSRVVRTGARGVANAKGFYRYTPEEAKAWETAFLKFSYEIRALAQRYPEEPARRGKRGTAA